MVVLARVCLCVSVCVCSCRVEFPVARLACTSLLDHKTRCGCSSVFGPSCLDFPRSASLCVCRAFGCSLAAVACLDSQTVGSLLPEQVVMYAFEVLDRKLDVVLAGVRECADVVAGLKAPFWVPR